MTGATFFVQQCPTCGRNLHVRVEYLGRSIACQHCHGEFTATENSAVDELDVQYSATPAITRLDQLLESAQRPKNYPR